MPERRELFALGDELVDDLGAQEAGEDADALFPKPGAAFGDDLLPRRGLESVDGVAVEIDEVSGRANRQTLRGPKRCEHGIRAASSSGRAGDF